MSETYPERTDSALDSLSLHDLDPRHVPRRRCKPRIVRSGALRPSASATYMAS